MAIVDPISATWNNDTLTITTNGTTGTWDANAEFEIAEDGSVKINHVILGTGTVTSGTIPITWHSTGTSPVMTSGKWVSSGRWFPIKERPTWILKPLGVQKAMIDATMDTYAEALARRQTA